MQAVDRTTWPDWVRNILRGMPSRASAWFFFGFSLLFGVGCLIYGFVKPWFFLGVFAFGYSVWYYLAIRWVDRHSRWSA